MYLKYYPFVPFFTMPGRIRLKIRIRPDRFRFAGRFSYLCGGKMHVMKKGILYAVLASVLWAIVLSLIHI